MKYLFFLFFILSCGEKSSGDSTDGIASTDHRVFVTSQSFNGNLGGVSGADAKCQSAALAQGLERSYKAILSEDNVDVRSRLRLTGAVYNFNSEDNSILVVSLGQDLWSSNYEASIEYNELFALSASQVWTGSTSEGRDFFDHCSSWTSSSSGVTGETGKSTEQNGQALEFNPESCDQLFPLYCISQ